MVIMLELHMTARKIVLGGGRKRAMREARVELASPVNILRQQARLWETGIITVILSTPRKRHMHKKFVVLLKIYYCDPTPALWRTTSQSYSVVLCHVSFEPTL